MSAPVRCWVDALLWFGDRTEVSRSPSEGDTEYLRADAVRALIEARVTDPADRAATFHGLEQLERTR